MKENGDVEFLDLFDPRKPRSENDEIARRLEICKTCPFFLARSQRCRKCGCFMQLKTTLKQAKCPVGKW
jgi:hypothetical protein